MHRRRRAGSHLAATVIVADHPGLVVAGDQAGEVEVRPRRLNVQITVAGLAGMHVRHVGLVVLHVRELLHQCRVLVEFLLRSDDELVHLPAVIDKHEANRLALLHGDAVGFEAHRIRHAEGDGSLDRLCISGDTKGLLFLDDGRGLFCVRRFAVRSGRSCRHDRQSCSESGRPENVLKNQFHRWPFLVVRGLDQWCEA